MVQFNVGDRVRTTAGVPLGHVFTIQSIRNEDGKDPDVNFALMMFGIEPGQPIYVGEDEEGEDIAVPAYALEAVEAEDEQV